MVAEQVADVLVGPVTNILTRAELTLLDAEEDGLRSSMIEDLQMIARNARRLAHVIDALRYAAGQGRPGWQPVRLNETVRRAAQANGFAGTRTVLDPAEPVVFADPTALEQLLKGVLAAATDLTPTDRIAIATSQPPDRPGWVELTIQGLSAVAALPASAGSTLEDHRASTEIRSGSDGKELAVCLPLFAMWRPTAPQGSEG